MFAFAGNTLWLVCSLDHVVRLLLLILGPACGRRNLAVYRMYRSLYGNTLGGVNRERGLERGTLLEPRQEGAPASPVLVGRRGKTHPRPLPHAGERKKRGSWGDTPGTPAGEDPCTPFGCEASWRTKGHPRKQRRGLSPRTSRLVRGRAWENPCTCPVSWAGGYCVCNVSVGLCVDRA
jgi:hypothetical protein